MKLGEVLPMELAEASLSAMSQGLHVGLPLRDPQGTPVSPAEAAREFEAYVLRLLLSEMRKTVGSGGLFSGSTTGTYEAMFEDALARRAAEAGTFGLAKQLLEQWGQPQ
jgi:Rod binding domain-containing protein